MITIATVVGARPQFVKAAVVSRRVRQSGVFREILIHTGQHYDRAMSDVFFETMEIPKPDIHLAIHEKTHGAQTGRMLEAAEKAFFEIRPDWVMVYGDTNSTLAGALAASKCHIPLAHVEAGLRSFNKRMPEEINRIVADRLSDLLFTPTETADRNLLGEGVPANRIHRCGDVMLEATRFYEAKAGHESRMPGALGLTCNNYALATIHRAENTDDPNRLKAVFGALCEFGRLFPVVIPLHPRTRGALERESLLSNVEQSLCVIEPVGYFDMLMLEKHARFIVTDSGGVQKEAFFHRTPCVTLRDETEWTELIEAGWNRLADPSNQSAIRDALIRARDGARPETTPEGLYGGEDASARILEVMEKFAH